MPPKRIAVIGAGASGLSAIKCCKEECLDVICYEKTSNFGGKWRYREDTIPGVASVMKTTVSVTSKEMGAFSDFPPPSSFPNYLHHTKVLEYLQLYAQHFDLLRHIKYHQEVIKVVPAISYEEDGKWLVTLLNKTNATESTEEFDGIMVCSGRLTYPYIPEFVGKDRFMGKLLHTHEVKTPLEFEDQKVLVVGIGNSAVDAAVEISAMAEQVYLSTRKGCWIFPMLGKKGLPFDMMYLRSHFQALKQFTQEGVNNYVEKHLESKFNHEMYKLKPHHRAMDKHPTVNDILPDKILTGRIIIKQELQSFEKNGVIFSGDDDVTEIDVVIFGTGYQIRYPFLDDNIFRNSNEELNLYKNVFPPDLKHHTLVIIGLAESQGSSIPISESQCRWVARVFNKKIKLPPQETMTEYLTAKGSKKPGYPKSSIEVDHIKYMDEIAEEYGAAPNISALLFKDPALCMSCFTGPFLPYRYRLVGPQTWNGARDAILKYHERVLKPLGIHKSNR